MFSEAKVTFPEACLITVLWNWRGGTAPTDRFH